MGYREEPIEPAEHRQDCPWHEDNNPDDDTPCQCSEIYDSLREYAAELRLER